MDTDKLNELLLTVQKPGRYTGGEWNSVKKEWTGDKVKVCLAFPDVYEVGMSYLGIKILYGILNNREDCLCERVFAPWKDFENVLRSNDIKLFSLESRRALKEFDIIGFSLAYELCNTNVLNILDLGGIPLRACERGDNDPLIIAGGPSSYNPEPMAEFVDAFVIGDGEEAIGEIVDGYKASKPQAVKVSRKRLLRELAEIEGVYVPSLYKVGYNPDGTISEFRPIEDGIPEKIKKRVVSNLDEAFYPTKQIVPNIQIVHDRVALEIMRGCLHACKFCQASATYRPVRERSKNNILKLAKEAHFHTGYDEISLLSLSSVDHSKLIEIIECLNSEFAVRSVSISVPSLRIEDKLRDIPGLVSKVKKSGLTFAPEAASCRLRAIINKNIDIEKLFKAAEESFKAGWRRVKLYFMIGLPGEEDKDVSDIAELVYKISNLKKAVDGRPANITVSVNPFIPKPHTPFELEGMDSIDELERKSGILKKAVRSRMIEIDFHPFRMSRLEAIFSRGDRKLAGAVYCAWRQGARFDGWQDILDLGVWNDAFRTSGIDQDFYIKRTIAKNEILPWGFIDI
ncbi:MAG: TIGR03960 family B12-binding radical SAM protein [Candidatus Omnitrophota bacterium]|nr:TIGR03960 family B12-binding radical SAM protein [Candidatus Omnitrophota bacterium]